MSPTTGSEFTDTCNWLIDNSSEMCGEPATPYANLLLCLDHQDRIRARASSGAGTVARQSAKYHPFYTFPGLCYFALLPDGKVKIGYSNTPTTITERMKALGRQYGAPLIKLAVIKGGFVAEAVMHDRFKDSRCSGIGERFNYTAEMAQFLDSLTDLELAEL